MKHLSQQALLTGNRLASLLSIVTMILWVGACGDKKSRSPHRDDNASEQRKESPPAPSAPQQPAPVPPAETALAGDCLKLNKLGSCLFLSWTNGPKMNQFNSAHVKLAPPPAQMRLKAFLWMRGMNHGSSPIKIDSQAPGEWNLNKIWFVMGGDWTLHLQLVDESGQLMDEVKVELAL